MTTKPPSAVQEAPADAAEKIAYTSVRDIPTEETNDRHRLGYHIWRWMGHRHGTIEQAVLESGSRLRISAPEAAKIITDSLRQSGIKVD
jgi:hypothetical protein